ncbi:plasmid transfer protein TraA [Streptomyces sp. NRRL B-24484]|uniref:plasmid transfer protein TraA n=1 Tax=Streptomyces sp. NRRL B-24484 TaxID=1463833 RepID=UPI00069433B0|nr:plasmid transfer protein TraA [Streptomyces sp. NRRL B-24484]
MDKNFFPPPQRGNNTGSAGGGGQRQQPGQGRTTNRTTNRSGPQFHFNYRPGGGSGPAGGGMAGGIGGQQRGAQGGGQGAGGRTHSPLADPEFFTNADIRNYCEQGRSAFLQLSFELAMAAEVLQAVLKEVPDADGRPFGSQFRARRVARHLKKAADDAKDAAANAARTYAAFQREYDPELSRTGRPRAPRRSFDFNG